MLPQFIHQIFYMNIHIHDENSGRTFQNKYNWEKKFTLPKLRLNYLSKNIIDLVLKNILKRS